jgi:hypothetical protein
MIGKQYKAHKDNVLDLFDSYKAKRGDLDDGTDIKFLESRIESLRKGKFTLAVAGEVKAGKSTFINALLGAEILPSDVLQTSSAIVEIFKSETSYLRVKYADENRENIYDNLETPDIDEAKQRLHEICKIHDEFRNIPTTLIDDYIVASDGELAVDDALLQELEERSGERLQGKNDIVKKFISQRTKDKIPVEIEFGYPLKWDFDELRIVDSPGVNAIGGVQDVAFRFFEEANAILFVHPIKPIESESFRKFVDSVISNRSKETLFLILTHAGLYANDEVKRLQAEAGRLYKNVIPEARILVVDSLLKLIHCDLENGLTVQEIRKTENKKKILSSCKEQAEEEGRELRDVVYESSRFAQMFAAIDEFSMKAPNLQLQEIVEKIKAGYEEQETQYTEKAERLEKKKRNPQEFEEEINRIQTALKKYANLIGCIQEDLYQNYSGTHSPLQKSIKALQTKYQELILGSDSIESIRKNSMDALNAIQETLDSLSREVRQKLEDILSESGKAFTKEHHLSIPKVDLKALEEQAKNNAYTEEETGYWDKEPLWKFWKWFDRDFWVSTGTKQVLDPEKFITNYRTICSTAVGDIISRFTGMSKKVVFEYLDLFSKEINSVIKGRQKALEEEKVEKQSNEEIIKEINELDEKKNGITPQKLRCVAILEDIT